MNRHSFFKLILPSLCGVLTYFCLFDPELTDWLIKIPLFIFIGIFLNKRVNQYEKLVDKRVASYKASLNEEEQKAFEAGMLKHIKQNCSKFSYSLFLAIFGFVFGFGWFVVFNGRDNVKTLKKLREELELLSKSTGGDLC